MRPDIRPLIDEAEKFLAHKFANVAENVDKLKNIDMAVLESMLSRDDLKAGSEDEVFDMVVELARSRFPKEELREALTPLISRIVRFTYMSREKLNEALTCDDLDQEVIKNAVLEAHFFKEKPLYCRRALIANLKESIARLFVRRAYTLLPIKFVELEHPNTQCIVYLDIKLEEFANLSPGDHMRSESFHFLEQKFHIEVRKKNAFPGKFRVYLSITNGLVRKIKANVQFAVRTKRCGEFYPWKISHMSHVFDEDVETWRHFLCKGTAIIAHDNFYFINGTTLYLRVVVTNLS
ncbi:hypothetical protein QJS04_geneDACA010669 [Acorus gramineus]|uniref:BACK domain-containing protein n=1 Tax=Acorus gramineus TaxID=55184 RepID=A0AAV9ALK0_ACOGR|nr:hypothetical protein QJS04_geneDACA010669 [Acorus gramineus]